MEDLIKALQIFLKYGNPHNPSNCSHDYFVINIDPEIVSEEDKTELDKLGFHINHDDGTTFGSFRYGSC